MCEFLTLLCGVLIACIALIVDTVMRHVIIYDVQVFTDKCYDTELLFSEFYDVQVISDKCLQSLWKMVSTSDLI